MGVKDLWNILSPSCDRKPLFELQGKTIAIDLSCWIVDSQTATDNIAQPKMYLRNLYFRTVYLLMQGTSPVFVLEGKAPSLKHKEIARRNDIRRGDEEKKRFKKGGRTRFNHVLKECETMLGLMGLKCIKGHGEAEAMCAYLNEDGLVDGCISQDSDCFLYGATTVYRNFCASSQGNRGGTGGSIDEYSMEKIQRLFSIGRNKMIALALLCGCDYDDGVNGVGKEAALKLFKVVEDKDILKRIKSWATDSKFNRMESELKDPNICTSCGHTGKVRLHMKSGCADCGTFSKCDESYKETRVLISNEISLRKKALLVEGFPSQDLIDEFLVRKGPMPSSLDLQWRQPQITEFIRFMGRHVAWEPEYAFAKIFPLMTRWQLRHIEKIPRESHLFVRGMMVPERIKKIRNLRGIASYEIIWQDKDGLLEGLTLGKTSDTENDSDGNKIDDVQNELVSIEPQNIFQKCYPELTEDFENARKSKKKKPSKPRERKKEVPAADKAEVSSEITAETKKKAPARRPRKKACEPANRKIDEFIQAKPAMTLEESFEAMSIEAKRSRVVSPAEFENINASETLKRGPQFSRLLVTATFSSELNGTISRMFDELTPDDFSSEMEDDSFNMSEVIERVCSKPTTQTTFNENISNTLCIKKNTEYITSPSVLKDTIDNRIIETEIAAAHDTLDDFDELDVAYVPLSQRLQLPNQPNNDRKNDQIVSKFNLGLSDLMNDSSI